MRTVVVQDLINRIDELQKFAQTLNTVVSQGHEDITLQMHIPVTQEEYAQLQNIGRAGSVLTLQDSYGRQKLEKPVARVEIKVEDIAPILGEFIEHCLSRSRDVYSILRGEVGEEDDR